MGRVFWFATVCALAWAVVSVTATITLGLEGLAISATMLLLGCLLLPLVLLFLED